MIDIPALFSEYYQLDSAAQDQLRQRALVEIEQSGYTLDAYYTELVRRNDCAAIDLISPLFDSEKNDELSLRIAHQLLISTCQVGNEDHVHFIQLQRNPASVPYFEKAFAVKTANPPYVGLSMFYDQCGYALRAIGTPAALALIEKAMQSEDAILAAGMRLFAANNMGGPAFVYPEDLWH